MVKSTILVRVAFLSIVAVIFAACGSTEPEAESSAAAIPAMEEPGAGVSPTARGFLARGRALIDARVSAAGLSDNLKLIAAKPHVAGSPQNLRVAHLVEEAFIRAGFEPRIDEYEVL